MKLFYQILAGIGCFLGCLTTLTLFQMFIGKGLLWLNMIGVAWIGLATYLFKKIGEKYKNTPKE